MARNARPVVVARHGRRSGTMDCEAGAHRSSALHGYGTPFLVFSLPMEPLECEELTNWLFYWWGVPEQEVRQQGSSLNLHRR
jgi:hypothetical protein